MKKRLVYCVSPEQSWPGALQYENLYDLAEWLATASVYVGNDSGITHLAAALNVPVVAIFQASDRNVWLPRGGAPVIGLQEPGIGEVVCAIERVLESLSEK